MTRRLLSLLALSGAVLVAALAPTLPAATAADTPSGAKVAVYIGTYTGGKSKGIYRAELDLKTGKLGEPMLAAEVGSPSFLTIGADHKHLYAVSEGGGSDKKPGGAVTAFSIGADGKLTKLNSQTSGGSGPCHLSLDRKGSTVLVANYGSGSIESLPVAKDGSLGAPATFIQHKGSSVDKGRQQGPHAHSINVDPSGRFAVAADLGLDKVLIYKLDTATSELTANDPAFYATAPGAGPRHFAFHPTKRLAFVINEMNLTLDMLSWDDVKGELKKLDSVSTVPADANRKGASTAEVVVHPSGKFVYGSNRGHDTIVGFKIGDKKLEYIGNFGEGVKVPRNFNIDPTGRYLLVANQAGDSVVVFAIDAETGKLTPTGSKIVVGAPVCLKMFVVE